MPANMNTTRRSAPSGDVHHSPRSAVLTAQSGFNATAHLRKTARPRPPAACSPTTRI